MPIFADFGGLLMLAEKCLKIVPKGVALLLGYVRVSSVDQNLDRQLEGLVIERLYQDRTSGKNRQRPGLEECLRNVRSGDELIVHSIDRLARNQYDLQQILKELGGKGVTVRFLKEGLEFPPDGKANPMQVLQLQLLGAFAEFERSIIRERQREGIEIARRKGKKFGRGKAITPAKEAEIRALREQGLSTRAIGEKVGCSHASVQRTLRKPVTAGQEA